jgi:esterase
MANIAYEQVASDCPPKQWMLFLHGFLGTKANWRTFAKLLNQAQPQWGIILVDLPMHGESQNFLAPYTLQSAALEILKLTRSLSLPVKGLLGHSFGGKVALKMLESPEANFQVTWLLDFAPWAPSGKESASTTYSALAAMQSLYGLMFESREEFVEKLIAKGFNRPTALWLAMNLRQEKGGYQLKINPNALASYLDDYFASDLSATLLEENPNQGPINFAIGGQSPLLSQNERQRILSWAKERPRRLKAHIFPQAGHDIHMDSQQELLNVVQSSLKTI